VSTSLRARVGQVLLSGLDGRELWQERDVEGACPRWASSPPDTSLDVKITF